MKWLIALGVSVIVIFALASIAFFRNSSPSLSPSPQSSPEKAVIPAGDNNMSYCLPSDLQSSLMLSPGAGNMYGTFSLKNISSKTCQIQGNNFIDINYETSSVKNITITHQGQTQTMPFELSPNQTLYSQIHYPNGPQCQSGIQSVPVSFSYKISPTDSAIFKIQNGDADQMIQICKSAKEITDVQIWEMSTKPISL